MKRKDAKGRVLKPNELQRKDGRYEYRYKDITGEKKSVYSWRLVPTDPNPKNKVSELSLRELEQNALKDSLNKITTKKQTLNERWDLYVNDNTRLKESTKNNYVYMYNKHVRNSLGEILISDINYTMVKKFFSNLITKKDFKPSSTETFYTMLRPVFTLAIRDGLIRINPTEGVMTEIKKSNKWEKTKRHALTKEETQLFLDYVKTNKKYSYWYPIFVCLFGTGCRMSEFAGLRWEDIHWKENYISIDHNLIYRPQEDGKMKYRITTPKTKASIRKIPMLLSVQAALKQEYARQEKEGFCAMVVDDYTGFIWQTGLKNPLHDTNINKIIQSIITNFNKEKKQQLPMFSAHTCRHTFCCRLCEQETDLKLIQEIMGHASITTTMDIYNESNAERKQDAFERIEKLGGFF